MSWQHKRAKLVQKLAEWPESRKHEPAMKIGRKTLTWWQVAERLLKEKKLSKVKKLVKQAEAVGLI